MKQSRLVYFHNAGVPATGLTPAFTSYVNVETLVSATAPSITEVGNGWYKYPDNISDFDHIVGIIDGGATLPDAYRYKEIELAQGDLTCPLEVKTGLVYNEETDSFTFQSSLEMNGSQVVSGMTSMRIQVYDVNNTEIINELDSTLTAGFGIHTANNPIIAKNETYYYVTTVILNNGVSVLGTGSYQTYE